LTAHFGKFVAYYRVSTDKQGQSGLGLDAQRQAVMTYLNGGPWKLIAEYTEVETGKRADRPELQKALAACRKHKAKLVIAKLDRLSRNLAFIATLMDSNVEFIAADNPHANRLTVHILAAVAEHERAAIRRRCRPTHPKLGLHGPETGRPDSPRDRSLDRPRSFAGKPRITRLPCRAPLRPSRPARPMAGIRARAARVG
jgi:hypothetical protein